jgi:hypothetical protein
MLLPEEVVLLVENGSFPAALSSFLATHSSCTVGRSLSRDLLGTLQV